MPEEAERGDKGTRTPPPQILLPLEERVTHFRDMLLERGVRTAGGEGRVPTAQGAPGPHSLGTLGFPVACDQAT